MNVNLELEKRIDKYIDVILKMCLNFKQSKSLLIHCDLKDHISFSQKIKEKAEGLGVNDIKILVQDIEEIHEYLKNTNIDEIKLNLLFDRSDLDIYAKKKGSILFLNSTIPNLMNDIDAEKIHKMTKTREKTMQFYRKNVSKYTFPWTIVAVPNKKWAMDLFNDNNSYEKLWDLILKMCMIDKEDPINEW